MKLSLSSPLSPSKADTCPECQVHSHLTCATTHSVIRNQDQGAELTLLESWPGSYPNLQTSHHRQPGRASRRAAPQFLLTPNSDSTPLEVYEANGVPTNILCPHIQYLVPGRGCCYILGQTDPLGKRTCAGQSRSHLQCHLRPCGPEKSRQDIKSDDRQAATGVSGWDIPVFTCVGCRSSELARGPGHPKKLAHGPLSRELEV